MECSFCGKTDSEVKILIHGPSVSICDRCVQLCTMIIYKHYVTTHFCGNMNV